MAKKAYKFTDKKHTAKGVFSVAAAVFSAVLTVYVIHWSFCASGNAGAVSGLLGLLAMLGAAVGFVQALRGLREEDVYYITAYVGAGINGVLLIIWILICVAGA